MRFLPDGNLQYLGRLDHQVKVRGFRVELGAVENLLQSHPGVQSCSVVAEPDGQGVQQILAYIVSPASTPITPLRRFLQARLPEYMIPTRFIFLEALPLNPQWQTGSAIAGHQF